MLLVLDDLNQEHCSNLIDNESTKLKVLKYKYFPDVINVYKEVK